jgi:hypothetical protein
MASSNSKDVITNAKWVEVLGNGGIALSHRIPLAKLKCLSDKRRKEGRGSRIPAWNPGEGGAKETDSLVYII